jgi:hypothetical protein
MRQTPPAVVGWRGMKTVLSLQRLAAEKAGTSFRGGQWVARRTLNQLRYPKKLISTVIKFVIWSRWEWEDKERELNCSFYGQVTEKKRSFYRLLYGKTTLYRDFFVNIIL